MAVVVGVAAMGGMVGQVLVVVMSQVQVQVMLEWVGLMEVGQVIVVLVDTTLMAGRHLASIASQHWFRVK